MSSERLSREKILAQAAKDKAQFDALPPHQREALQREVAAIAIDTHEGGDAKQAPSRSDESADIAQNVSGTYPPDEQLRLKRDAAEELYEALAGILARLDNGRDGYGHGHLVTGVWDDDDSNGDMAGKPCEWCAHWKFARAALAKARGELA